MAARPIAATAAALLGMAVALNPAALGIPAATGGALAVLAAGWWCRRWFTSAGERPNEQPGDMTT